MRDFKVFQILRTFTEDEWKKFLSFTKSSYFNGSRDYSGLIKQVYLYRNNKEELLKISTSDFFNSVFQGKKYNNKTLRNRLNELTKLCEKFIIQKTLENDDLLKKKLLLQGLNDRKLLKIFHNEYLKTVRNLNDSSLKSHTISEILLQKAFSYKGSQDFKGMFESFNVYSEYLLGFFLERLFSGAYEYEIEKSYGINPTTSIFYDIMSSLNTAKLIKIIEEKNNQSYLYILFYYYLYKSISEINNPEWIKKFRKLFFHNINKIEDNLKNNFITYMISYYFIKINSGERNLLKDVFKLYKLKLRLGMYSDLNEIRYPSSAYRDYIVVGIRLKKFKWVEEFINKYSSELPEEIRDEEVCMAYSRLFFGLKDFNKSLEMLNKIKFKNYLNILDTSRDKLKIYYETSEFEDAFMEMDRIKHYIKNNTKKIARSVRIYSKDFLDKYNVLLKLRLSPDKNELICFIPVVKNAVSLVSKEWFIEKLGEMKENQ